MIAGWVGSLLVFVLIPSMRRGLPYALALFILWLLFLAWARLAHRGDVVTQVECVADRCGTWLLVLCLVVLAVKLVVEHPLVVIALCLVYLVYVVFVSRQEEAAARGDQK